METLITPPPKKLTKLIITKLLIITIISSQTNPSTSLSIDLGIGDLIPPISAPSLIPDLLNFVDKRLAVVFPVIQAFKNTITSDPLGVTKTWTGSDICSYTGFFCGATPENASATAVASVDFNGFWLSAPTLDAFLAGLPDLALFHANSNNFSGSISLSAAKSLSYLFELDISNNRFHGPFPGAAVSESSLTFLDARFNAFSGPVPPEVFLLQTLDFVFLNNNAFTGTLPDSLGSSRARYITLANNMISGEIPRSIGNTAETLTEFLVRGNSLSGCLPNELGLLKKAVLFDAQQNLLTGPIPQSLRCMESLEVLNLAENRLYGTIPETLCALGSLANFSLAGNYFTRIGVACKKLVGLGVLDVRRNCLAGLPEQRGTNECAAFSAVPRSCGFPSKLLNIEPCGAQKATNKSPPAGRRRPRRNLVSYAALSRRKLATEFVA